MYDGTTRNAYHLYMFRYDAERFHGLGRNKFIKALEAEGVPSSSGYGPLNKEPFISDLPRLRSFQRCFSSNDLRNYPERIQCPENDKLCDEAVWFQQTMLLGSRSDMDQIIEAVRKIHSNAAALAKA
jgi:perosamine synthetase